LNQKRKKLIKGSKDLNLSLVFNENLSETVWPSVLVFFIFGQVWPKISHKCFDILQ